MNILTRRQLFDILYERVGEGRSRQTEYLFSYLVQHYQIENDENAKSRLKKINSKFCSAVYSRLDKCARKIDRFLENNRAWLSTIFIFEKEGEEIEETGDQQASTSSGTGGSRGRPKVSFTESSTRTKRRRAEKLSGAYEAEELTLAAFDRLRKPPQMRVKLMLNWTNNLYICI